MFLYNQKKEIDTYLKTFFFVFINGKWKNITNEYPYYYDILDFPEGCDSIKYETSHSITKLSIQNEFFKNLYQKRCILYNIQLLIK